MKAITAQKKWSGFMNRTFRIGNKDITFYTGKVDDMNCLAYSEDINGKTFLFWAETQKELPKNETQAMEYIESLSWEIDWDGEFRES